MIMGKQTNRIFHSYRKPCRRCDKSFNPSGKYHRICDQCRAKAYYWRKTAGGEKNE